MVRLVRNRFPLKIEFSTITEPSRLRVLVKDKLRFFLLGFVDRHTGKHRFWQFIVLSSLNHKTNLHKHLAAARGNVVDGLLGKRGELVHVDVHLHVLNAVVYAPEDRSSAPEER